MRRSISNPLSNSNKFGVVIPYYNRKDRICRCLDSINRSAEVAKDTVQVVIVDDGSNKENADFLDELSLKYYSAIELNIIHKKNGSCCQARAEGIRLLSGLGVEYTVHIDSDDYVMDNMVTDLSYLVNNYPNVDVMLTWMSCYNIGIFQEYRYQPYRYPEPCYQVIPADINKINNISNPVVTKICKTELWYRAIQKLDPKLYINCGEDLILETCLFSEAKTMMYTDKGYYVYEFAQPDSIVQNTEYSKPPADLIFARNMAYFEGMK